MTNEAKPQPNPKPQPIWKWWVSSDGENYHASYRTRDEAVAAIAGWGADGGGWICEACEASISLADYFDVTWFLEFSDENAADDHGDPDDGVIFDVSQKQVNDLSLSVRAAISEWQSRHGLVFGSGLFAGCRNAEYISVNEK